MGLCSHLMDKLIEIKPSTDIKKKSLHRSTMSNIIIINISTIVNYRNLLVIQIAFLYFQWVQKIKFFSTHIKKYIENL